MRAYALLLLPLVASCGIDTAPAAPGIPSVCEAQVYADPTVKDLLMKRDGSITFARQHEDELKFAKIDAAHRCMQLKGLLPPGGGVERPTVSS